MSLIEKAAKRLEELRRAGAELPGDASDEGKPGGASPAAAESVPTPEAVVHALGARTAASPGSPQPDIPAPSAPAPAARETAPGAAAASPTRYLEIDMERLRGRGFITPDEPRSQIADEFRIMKRPIIRNARSASAANRNRNLVMVTSSLPREGKTFTAINLAISIAMEYDNTVLLVDGDVAHPSLPSVLGLPASPGLLDLLGGRKIDFADAVVKTNIEKLSILPAGSRHRRATELLASEQMASFLRELASRYPDRIIVFDSPPLLATTEARVLATHMGQVVLVVAANSTTQHAANQALATVENCDIVLMMLNKASKTDVGTYYGYYADEASG